MERGRVLTEVPVDIDLSSSVSASALAAAIENASTGLSDVMVAFYTSSNDYEEASPIAFVKGLRQPTSEELEGIERAEKYYESLIVALRRQPEVKVTIDPELRAKGHF